MEITFKRIGEEDFKDFANDVQNALSEAVIEEFGDAPKEEIIPLSDIYKSLNNLNSEVFYFFADNQKAGGAAISIDKKQQKNSLDLFYLYPQFRGKGIGSLAWSSIEKMYPEAKTWETVTPYFEKRNIHFYVNKCGFHIVEFFNKRHIDVNTKSDPEAFEEDYFRFEKVIENK